MIISSNFSIASSEYLNCYEFFFLIMNLATVFEKLNWPAVSSTE
jgi:hypothetical protein